MCFIPVELDALNCTIFKPHGCNAFELAPASDPEDATQAGYLAYPTADGDWFDLFDCANDLKSSPVGSFIGGLKEY